MDISVHFVIFLAENLGMIRVSGYALDAEERRMLKSQNVRVDGRVGLEPHGLALLDQLVQGGRRFESCGALWKINFSARRFHLGLESFSELHGAFDQRLESCRIKVDVRQGGERRLHRENVDLVIIDTLLAAFHCVEGQTLQRVDQQVLERSHIRRFPANTDLGATFAFCRLFTLITKHNPPPFGCSFSFLDFDPSLHTCLSLRFDLCQETQKFFIFSIHCGIVCAPGSRGRNPASLF